MDAIRAAANTVPIIPVEQPRRLLVVDDESAILTMTSRMLSPVGWSVSAVETFHEAIALLQEEDFDVVLTDFHLGSGNTGLDFLRRMPSRNAGKPFIVFSGHGTQERCREAFLAGATDFVSKPFHPADLLKALGHDIGDGPSSDETRRTKVHADSCRQRVIMAVQFIEKQFRELDLTRDAIASHANTSPDYLGRLFDAQLGCTPMQYVHEIRINHAERLLLGTSLSVYEVARDCGYRSGDELAYHLKHRHSCTPTEYRTNRRE